MTCVRFIEFLLVFLLHQVCSEEPEPVFRAKGSAFEMGYCFGVDYIVVYRSAPEGDQLLGNSSNENMTNTPPADLQGRTHMKKDQQLLGLQVSNLTHLDSGIYRRECWQNNTRASQHRQQLSVCNQEIESEEIIVEEEGGGAELLCNSTFIGLEGTSVRWYHEMYPSYALTLILDSSVSLKLLVENLPGVVDVRDNGALLVLDNSMMKNNQHFYCLVMKGMNCLSFQIMYPPDYSESREIFASKGDRVILNCPIDGDNQLWETPLGRINSSNVRANQMRISVGDKLEDFSLVIPVISDEHSGEYSCISSSLEMHYSLVLCTKEESQTKVVYEGGDVSLSCRFDQDGNQKVQWHRHDVSGQYELLWDSKDDAVPVPEDLIGRLTLSENGHLLTISDLKVKDEGEYWCVILYSPGFVEDDDEYKENYDEEQTEEYEFSDDHFWIERCILKEETILTVSAKAGTGSNLVPVTSLSGITTTPGPLTDSNIIAYALGAGLVGLLVVGAIVTVIVVKKRAKASLVQREAASGVRTNKDIQMDADPGCMERLPLNDDVA